MEAVIIVDCFRRANWDVTAAGVPSGAAVAASRGVALLPDAAWDTVDPGAYDVLAIPGGMGGTRILAAHDGVLAAVRELVEQQKLVGAICAGPLVLQAAGVLSGRRMTCHPGVRDELTAASALDEAVVVDGHVVTSQGPGTAMAFALTIIELLEGEDCRRSLEQAMIL